MTKSKSKVQPFDGVCIVGSGLVGCMAALLLAQKGYQVKLFELRKDFRKERADFPGQKYSINLALSYRGQVALKKAGILEEAMKLTIPMYGRAIHSCDQTKLPAPLVIQRYDEIDPKNFINSVSRFDLNELLLNTIDKTDGVEVIFRHKFLSVEEEANSLYVSLENLDAKKTVQICPKLIIGADGAYSSVRNYLARLNYSDFSRRYIEHGYKELTIEASDGDFRLPKHAHLHIWPKNEFMMIGLPNLDRTFTCTLFAERESLNLTTKEEIIGFFKTNFPDIFSGDAPTFEEDTLVEQYLENPSQRLVSITLDNWRYTTTNTALVVVGDAAHACVPFYGQGMNAGLEDAQILAEMLPDISVSTQSGINQAIDDFNALRVKSGHVVGELSMHNYVEMKKKTNSRIFLYRKKLEGLLNKILGSWYLPLYKMVSFTAIPYAEVMIRDRRQQVFLNGLLALTGVGLGLLSCAGLAVSRNLYNTKTLF